MAWIIAYALVALLVMVSAGLAFKEPSPEGWHIGVAVVWPLFIVLVLMFGAYRIGRWLAMKEAQ